MAAENLGREYWGVREGQYGLGTGRDRGSRVPGPRENEFTWLERIPQQQRMVGGVMAVSRLGRGLWENG